MLTTGATPGEGVGAYGGHGLVLCSYHSDHTSRGANEHAAALVYRSEGAPHAIQRQSASIATCNAPLPRPVLARQSPQFIALRLASTIPRSPSKHAWNVASLPENSDSMWPTKPLGSVSSCWTSASIPLGILEAMKAATASASAAVQSGSAARLWASGRGGEPGRSGRRGGAGRRG